MASQSKRKAAEASDDEQDGDDDQDGPPEKKRYVARPEKGTIFFMQVPVALVQNFPTEIRLKVYEFALTSRQGQVFDPKYSYAEMRRYTQGNVEIGAVRSQDFTQDITILPKLSGFVNLLLTSRTVYNEASNSVYEQEFYFTSVLAFQRFLLRLHPSTLSRLRRLRIAFEVYAGRRGFEMSRASFAILRGVPDLKSLEIEPRWTTRRTSFFHHRSTLNYGLTGATSTAIHQDIGKLIARHLYFWCKTLLDALFEAGGEEKVVSVMRLGGLVRSVRQHYAATVAKGVHYFSDSVEQREEDTKGAVIEELKFLRNNPRECDIFNQILR